MDNNLSNAHCLSKFSIFIQFGNTSHNFICKSIFMTMTSCENPFWGNDRAATEMDTCMNYQISTFLEGNLKWKLSHCCILSIDYTKIWKSLKNIFISLQENNPQLIFFTRCTSKNCKNY